MPPSAFRSEIRARARARARARREILIVPIALSTVSCHRPPTDPSPDLPFTGYLLRDAERLETRLSALPHRIVDATHCQSVCEIAASYAALATRVADYTRAHPADECARALRSPIAARTDAHADHCAVCSAALTNGATWARPPVQVLQLQCPQQAR